MAEVLEMQEHFPSESGRSTDYIFIPHIEFFEHSYCLIQKVNRMQYDLYQLIILNIVEYHFNKHTVIYGYLVFENKRGY